MLTQNNIALVKIESTYGLDPTPTTSSNFIALSNVKVNPNMTYNETTATDGSLSPRAGTLGKKHIELSFDHELQVAAGAVTAPPCLTLLRACGMANTSGSLVPRTTGFESCTIWVYEEDILWKVTGCRGNVAWNFTAGEPVKLTFTMQGRYAAPIDSTFPTSWTDAGAAPLVAMNKSFDFNTSIHPVVESLSFSLNYAMVQNPSIDDAVAHGINAITYSDRNPEGSFNPEMTKASDIDFWTGYAAVTQFPIAYVVGNSSAKCTISIPKAELMGITPGDRSGTLIYDIPFKMVRNAGDDELSIVFAAA